ncbi:unnamed protein product, partial [Rotaria magnacalcarata]
MPNCVPACFLTLPVEIVYRILDNLDNLTLLCATRNVCQRLNMITETYHRYQNIYKNSTSGKMSGNRNKFLKTTSWYQGIFKAGSNWLYRK